MTHLALQPQIVRKPDYLTVNPGTDKSLLQEIVEQIAKLALLAADQRCENDDPDRPRQVEDLLENLLAGLGRDRSAALRAVAGADPGVEYAKIIVDLGDCADRAARALAGRFLGDRNRRAQALDPLDVRLGHLAEKLPRVAREALDVAALALGVERVEGQRALARAAHARQANELVSRQDEIDAAEIMLSGTFDNDVGSGHGTGAGVSGYERGKPGILPHRRTLGQGG